MHDLPRKAISIRQPWAWAIVHAGKDVENRGVVAIKHMNFAGVERLAIHAAKGMTRDEYRHAAEFMASINIECPAPAELLRGGIIGHARFDGVKTSVLSRWFFGPRGIVLRDPKPSAFVACVGALGLFDWRPAENGTAAAPALWMTQKPTKPETAPREAAGDLFG